MTATATYDGYGNTVATSGSTSSPYQFGATSGYRNDGDAGIMQVGARYYDPATGSFLTRDTDLSQLAYVYCGEDPIDNVDPSGHDGIFDGAPTWVRWTLVGWLVYGGGKAIANGFVRLYQIKVDLDWSDKKYDMINYGGLHPPYWKLSNNYGHPSMSGIKHTGKLAVYAIKQEYGNTTLGCN